MASQDLEGVCRECRLLSDRLGKQQLLVDNSLSSVRKIDNGNRLPFVWRVMRIVATALRSFLVVSLQCKPFLSIDCLLNNCRVVCVRVHKVVGVHALFTVRLFVFGSFLYGQLVRID